MNSKQVVIAHYMENLNWVEQIDYLRIPCIVYSKTNKRYNYIPENKGQEALMYLRHIIDNYSNLADRTFFMHGHKNSYHQDYPSLDLVKVVNWEGPLQYFNVNKREFFNILYKNSPPDARCYFWLRTYWDLLFKGYFELPERIEHYACAQFVVSKELILSNTLEFYQHCYNFLIHTEIDNYITSRLFEFTWHYIFTKSPVETKYEYHQILR